ncbi:LTA synthase family protein [Clostridium sp. ZS1]|uniref:LTA synthase family protein n=1 Tax=Clostridium sp. ZS1 TaxID=2949989 RepID=UPI002079A27B|nr:LTA synthase family protein [Clostridium sp. ZS1]
MNKYNLTLENLIYKYFGKNEKVNTVNPINLIAKIIKDKCENKKFAIWGAGEHTIHLHKHLSAEIKEAQFIIDNDKNLTGTEILGFKVIHPNDLKKYDIDVILISSYAGAKGIKKEILDMNLSCESVNFYEILEDMGVELQGTFFSNPSIYMDLYDLKDKYNNTIDKNEKERYVTELIYLYLKVRDFDSAKMFINEYIQCEFSNKEKIKLLLQDIYNLINEISDELKKRNGKDIILMFLDSLRAKDVYSDNSPMKFLNGILKNSLYFKKACSTSIFTNESVPSMLSGNMPFLNSLYKRKTVNEDECSFIKSAINKGFKIKIYASSHWNIIDGENIQYGEDSNYAPETLWNAVCDLAESKNEDTLYLLYFCQETHPPHICGNHSILPKGHITPFTCNDVTDQTQEDYSKQYNESLIYIDNQIRFYFDIITDNTVKVIFSDHGQLIDRALSPLKNIGTLAGWNNIRYKVPFIINGKNIIPEENNKLYSMKNFGKVIDGILNDNVNIVNSDIIEVNFSKINNSVIIEKYKNEGYEDYLYGFKVFVSDKYKLVITGNGKKKVYETPDEFNEVRDMSKVEDIIAYFKQNNCDFSMPQW